LIYNIILAPTR